MFLAFTLGWFLRAQVGGYGRAHRVALVIVCVAVVMGFIL